MGTDSALVKENPATHIAADAAFALSCARSASSDNKEEETARFARIAILLYAVSLEAFINFVYTYFDVPEPRWRHLSLRDKWLGAAKECLACQGVIKDEQGVVYRPGDSVEGFNERVEPFISFLELKRFRDSVVHLHPPFLMTTADQVESHLAREERYRASGLPKRLQHCGVEDVQIAKRIYDAMTEELDRQMKGLVLRMFIEEGAAWIETRMDDDEDEAFLEEDS